MSPVDGNRLDLYYMGLQNIPANYGCILVTPLPNPSGNTGVMVCMSTRPKCSSTEK